MGLIYFRCLGELNSYAAGAYSILITSSLKYACIINIYGNCVSYFIYETQKDKM